MKQLPKRDQILQTAGKLFMQNGFQAVSMDQIAASVPVSKPTLYAHFKDKRELFGAVIGLRCAVALSALQAGINEGRTAEETLEMFGRQFLALLLSKEALQFHRVMIGESESFPEMAQLFYETGPKKMHGLLEEYLIRLDKEGVLKVEDASVSADIFLGMLKGRMHLKSVLGLIKEGVTEAEREKFVKTLVKIFVMGQKS